MVRTAELSTTEDLQGEGGLLDVPGKYHFMVIDIKDGEMPNSNDPLNGFSVKLKVLHGEQKDKTIGLILGDPNMSHKDGGKMAQAKQTALLVAANVITPDQCGQTVSYDEQLARHSQIIAQLSKRSDKPEYLDWNYTNIYHVDDPRVKSVPKCEQSLGLIPQEHRHDAAFFASMIGKKTNVSAAPSNTPVSANASNMDFSDL